ncbi:MAG: hypothetical protein MK116_13725 [Phycisphaerales bacterium]|nr:hypothetical protein [Phycisphaerales bacterium]
MPSRSWMATVIASALVAHAVADDCTPEPCDLDGCVLDCTQGFVDTSTDACTCERPLPEPTQPDGRVIWDGAFTTINSQPCDGPGGRWSGGWNDSAAWNPTELEFRTTREVETCNTTGNGYLRVGHATGFSEAGPPNNATVEVTGQTFGVLPCWLRAKADGTWRVNMAFRSRRVTDGCAAVQLSIAGDTWEYKVENGGPQDDCEPDSWTEHQVSIPINEISGQVDSDDVIREVFWNQQPRVRFVHKIGSSEAPEVHYDDLEITLTIDGLTTMDPLPVPWCVNLLGQAPTLDCGNIESAFKSICCQHWNGGGQANWILPESCPADLDTNCLVDVDDLLKIISNFDGTGSGDLNCDGIVDVNDLLQMLDAFGENCC